MSNDKPFNRPLGKLTRKQAIFVKYLLDNPKASGTQAALAAYNLGTQGGKQLEMTAAQIASENLRKPQIMAVLQSASEMAEKTVVEALQADRTVVSKGGTWKEADHAVRLRAADSILDRLHGRATQRIEQHSTSVSLEIDLTGSA